MARRGRVVLSTVAFVLVILLTVLFLSYRLLTKALPKTSGTISLDILESRVEVYRDTIGVPHIFASNETDLFRAAGYVTAQDRLWQMDLNRRVAQGRLAELFGESALATDKFIRTWGFQRTATEIAKVLSPESRLALEAYASGVNAFIDSNKDRLPVEFSVLRYEPEPWKVEDSLAFTRLMAWRLSFGWYVDLVLHQIVQKLGLPKAREVFPGFPKNAPSIISSKIRPLPSGVAAFLDAGVALREFLGIEGMQIGSNSWVVSGAKSACGKPLLANDPHLELVTPSVWYEMHLSGGELNVAGVSLPGTPGLVIGHNEKIAWGLTNGMVDDADFYFERLNPEDSTQYWNAGEWQQFDIVEETISIKDDRPVTFEIRVTRNGPVISEIHPALDESGEVVSIRWVGFKPSDELAAALNIQKSGNWMDFTQALRNFKVPTQNFVFASVDGDIGYYLGGDIPIRRNGTGILPLDGWTDRDQWEGFIPFEELPHVLNPPQNFIATANNKIVADRYPYYITNLWEPPGRAARINQLLAAKEKFTIEDFKTIQTDVTSLQAQKIMPRLLNAVKVELSADSAGELRTLYDLIKDWDGEETIESIPTAIYHAFFLKLLENTFQDEMGESLYKNYIRLASVPTRVIFELLETDRARWFDDVTTEELESRDKILVKSLLDGAAGLRELAGEPISNWAWGRLHTLTMEHPLGRQRPLDTLFNLGPYPRGGSSVTINNAQYRLARPFQAFVGPSTRQLVDLCKITHSQSIITSGQSGQRMSDHYKDQTPLWLAGEYHSLVMDRELVEQTAKSHLVLEPRRISSSRTN